MTLKVLLVDDEPLAREGLRGFLADEPGLEIVGECGNGIEALERIEDLEPDLVFLDVQMPELDGFGVVEALGGDAPAIVFVTAYDEYALKAFEVNALDYLLKPVEESRFRAALKRARERIEAEPSEVKQELEKLLGTVADRPNRLDRLVVKSRGKIVLLPIGDIDWVEADGNYARIHVGEKFYLIRETMAALERKLDPTRFVRIHRSAIVALDQVKEIQPWFKGELMVLLQNGQELSLSRKYRKKLQELLGQRL